MRKNNTIQRLIKKEICSCIGHDLKVIDYYDWEFRKYKCKRCDSRFFISEFQEKAKIKLRYKIFGTALFLSFFVILAILVR